MKFIEQYPIKDLRPADYNPRKIAPGSFERLKESISRYGVVKPVILNGNGVLTAGHQRIKAMKALGMKTVPAIMLRDISLHDEIKFNLFHNSIETSKSYARILNADQLPVGYSFVEFENYEVGENLNSSIVKSINDLYIRYGNWGYVVCDHEGRIILNSDYAVGMARFKEKLLVYKVGNDGLDLCKLLNENYGSYFYEALQIKPWVQHHCQMSRVKNEEKEALRSTLYETHVLPYLKKDQTAVDFGAGKMAYVSYLQGKGFRITGYEPYFKKSNSEILISKVVEDIEKVYRAVEKYGLFDVVILDSVINSVTSIDYERFVMTTCNALLKPNGTFFMATRCKESADQRFTLTKSTSKGRIIEFLDENNFSATFRQKVWTLQKFHSKESFLRLVGTYFHTMEYSGSSSQHYAVAKGPIQFDEEVYREALEVEFNMEYPGGYKHNKHERLVNQLIKLVKERNVSDNS